MEESEVRVGQRVRMVDAGREPQTGTVQYVGPVEGHGGAWAGVDWDNGEGRHDGSVNGVRYFQAKHALSGSFVRPRNLSPGVSLLEALSLRYKTAAARESDQGATTPLFLIPFCVSHRCLALVPL
jgi:dynactin complex subunit